MRRCPVRLVWHVAHSDRIEYIAINTVDFINCSGGTLRRPPGRVHRIEDRTELGEHRVDHDTDLADRMIDRDQILGAQRGQHRQLRIGASTHAPNLFDPATDREHPPPNFSTLNPRGLSLGSAV